VARDGIPFAALALAMLAGVGGCASDGPGAPRVVVVELRVAPTTTTLGVFGRNAAEATPRDASGNVLEPRPVTWTSNNESVATVSPNGLIVGRSAGTARITATITELDGPLSGHVEVTVEPYLALDSVSAGGNHTCGLTFEGEAFCWGSNSFGQLGNGGDQRSDRPVRVLGGITFRQISAGFSHTCGIAVSGAAFCWGRNAFGALGDGDPSEFPPSRNVPTPVAGGLTYTDISAGWQHTCAVDVGGLALCWGLDSHSGLGNGPDGDNKNSPVVVAGGLQFTSISAGQSHSCGVTVSGAGVCWGDGRLGALGADTASFAHSPVSIAGGHSYVSITAGWHHSCARTTAGAYCWGANGNGALGDGTRDQRRVPTAVSVAQPQLGLSLRSEHACATGTDGVTRCWGINIYGQLASGGFALSTLPLPITGGMGFARISAGRAHTCGVASVGLLVYCWGRAIDGALGHGVITATEATSPVRVVAP
jgi:alpha-tubulin suppressor-like RCC1 family protein